MEYFVYLKASFSIYVCVLNRNFHIALIFCLALKVILLSSPSISNPYCCCLCTDDYCKILQYCLTKNMRNLLNLTPKIISLCTCFNPYWRLILGTPNGNFFFFKKLDIDLKIQIYMFSIKDFFEEKNHLTWI